jgi:hypothetical protein
VPIDAVGDSLRQSLAAALADAVRAAAVAGDMGALRHALDLLDSFRPAAPENVVDLASRRATR